MTTSHVTAAPPRFSTSNDVVGNHYRTGKKISEGSVGVVFEGSKISSGIPVAIKFMPRKSDVLKNEFRVYQKLNGTPGIPQLHYFGEEGLHNALIIDLLGPNLEDLFDMCGRKFSIKTVCMAAKQMVTRVQSVHEKSLIYRDIKPDDFLLGVPGGKTANTIHLIDFGMAKSYRDPRTKVHIPYRERKLPSGNVRYMSINTHLGREQSRRDDLESLGYVFMYFLRGGLPWQGLRATTNRQKYEKMGEKKQMTPSSELCEGFPEEFTIYMNYVRALGFEETPDYDFLRELLANVLKELGEKEDGVYDWMLLNGGKGWVPGIQSTPKFHHHDASHDPVPPRVRLPPSQQLNQQARELGDPVVLQRPYTSANARVNYQNRADAGSENGHHSPNTQAMPNGNVIHMNPSEHYHASSPATHATNSRGEMMNPPTTLRNVSGTRMGMYDRDTGEHSDDGRNEGSWTPYQQCTTLAMKLMAAKATNKLISELGGDEAQCVADFLSKVVYDEETFTRRERKHSIHLLSKLAKPAQVFPQSLELEGVQCNLTHFVAAGGYGFIYKGEHEGSLVCIKAVQIGTQGIEKKKIRAHASELTIWAHLDHPNILPFLGIYLSKEEVPRICIVSPWMVNGDLLQYLENFPEAPRKPLVRHIISGLQYLHDLDIIHADLKAKNVLVSETGRAMLADFGISRLSITQTTILTTASTGTAYWMAPELHLNDNPRPSRETDIWAFACTCYEVMTGMTPFSQYHNPAILVGAFMRGKIVPVRPERPGIGWDEDLWSVATRCWKRTPASRPKAHELLNIMNGFGLPDDHPLDPGSGFQRRIDAKVDYDRIFSIFDEIRRSAAALKVDEVLENETSDVGTERFAWLRRGSRRARELFQAPSRFLR